MAASEKDGPAFPRPVSLSGGTPQPIRPSARGVQSIEIGGRLLAALVRSRQPMMLRDLAAQAGLTPGQAHAYLVSFRKLEIVEQDAATGRYQLGPFALHLGLARQRSTDAVRLATAAAPALAEETDLMTVVTVWGSGGATVVYVEEAANQILINVKPGITYSIIGTATGKVFAAFLPPKIVDPAVGRELQNLNLIQQAGGPVDPDALKAEIASIRRRGYATTVDRPIPGSDRDLGAGLRFHQPHAARRDADRPIPVCRHRSAGRAARRAAASRKDPVGTARLPARARNSGGRKPLIGGRSPRPCGSAQRCLPD